jgi:hypothetical protein
MIDRQGQVLDEAAPRPELEANAWEPSPAAMP